MGSRKNGALTGSLKERSLTERVRVLCEVIGIEGASAHDGRHSWATRAVKAGTNMRVLQDYRMLEDGRVLPCLHAMLSGKRSPMKALSWIEHKLSYNDTCR